MTNQQEPVNSGHAVFDSFVLAQTCKEVQQNFSELCRHLKLDAQDYRHFYSKLKEKLNYWKAKELWQKIDKRASHPDYDHGKPCAKTKCLVLGGGPCGLRTAIELALLGAQVVLLEKRTSFSRNNVLHLWPYTIRDLRNLGAKKFYGKFCSGSLDHISIRQLQLILLKLALLLGVEVHTGVTYNGLVEPQASGSGWRALLHPEAHPASSYQFDVFISAGGGRFVPDGFKRKELRGKLAIGITANFVNHRTAAEAQVPEISGVARIYNQKFFQELHTEMGIDLENIVYYKDDTHYFVMTAKKNSLLKKGVIKQDYANADQLLALDNVNDEALLSYAHDAAAFSTGHKLPDLEFARNHKGEADVAMFDFTCMHRAENSSMVMERRGKKLLIGLVGDCLVEPFWPLGTGIARGFLAAFDAAWMVRSWGKGTPHIQVLAERESVYQLLSQTTPENTSKNYSAYSIDPNTRYPNVNVSSIKPTQVQHLYNVEDHSDTNKFSQKKKLPLCNKYQASLRRVADLLSWCQKHTAWCDRVKVKDLSQSWRSGLALCALIQRFRPKLIDVSTLDENNATYNNQMAFDILQKEFGIAPIMSARDFASRKEIDQLSVVLYLTQVHNAFTETPKPAEQASLKSLSLAKTRSAVFFLNKLKHNSLQRRKERLAAEREEKDRDMREEEKKKDPVPSVPTVPMGDVGSSELCYFCSQQLYVLERGSAEGKFFHRSCFTCQQCGTTLRQGGYTFYADTGRFYCEQHSEPIKEKRESDPCAGVEDGKRTQGSHNEQSEDQTGKNEGSVLNVTPVMCRSVKRKGSYKISIDPDCDETTESSTFTQHEDQLVLSGAKGTNKPGIPTELGPVSQAQSQDNDVQKGEESSCPVTVPVPAPRSSRVPIPKPRTVHNIVYPPTETEENQGPDLTTSISVPVTVPEDDEASQTPAQTESGQKMASDSKSKLSLKKLQLTAEEKTQLMDFTFSQDSDSETPASSSSTSSSSRPQDGGGAEEEGYSSGGASWGHVRQKKFRRGLRRKEEVQREYQHQQGRIRSKFSPWNLSSPRLRHRFSVLRNHPSALSQADSEDEVDCGDEDDDDDDNENEEDLTLEHFMDGQAVPLNLSKSEKQDLMKMRTLERRAKMSELQRLRQAQSIQRRLEEIEVTFKDLEEKGVVLERSLRRQADASTAMIDQWIDLVQQKNALVSEESDLMVASRQLELEDKQSMLELELRGYIDINDSEKTADQQAEEDQILQQMLEVVDTRNSLVAFLEEKRLKEMEEEHLSSSLVENKRLSTAGAQIFRASMLGGPQQQNLSYKCRSSKQK
ncbi:F-actin-monooxygenase mical1 isoform X2 [Neoarius graeffei]|uniref:F-actin-monooxygenase mical1 isoform X2 n=1 Tax=Neoarius graeffei TaxID=443677 RepID=UPI00298C6271|nr:F-actin-monooxygenase mical1 isoform X2 [Neoarius graeffei]